MNLFCSIIAYCLCGVLALRIAKKIDKKTKIDWLVKVFVLMLGPYFLIMLTM